MCIVTIFKLCFQVLYVYIMFCPVHCTHLIGVTSIIVESVVSGYWKCKDNT